jgi:hypothetical protein
MGHHNGAFLIRDNVAIPLDNSAGFWTFLPVSNILPSSLMVAGNYLGLSFFNYDKRNFYKTGINAQFASARFVVVENERTTWVAHPYKGIYRVRLNPDNTTTIMDFFLPTTIMFLKLSSEL